MHIAASRMLTNLDPTPRFSAELSLLLELRAIHARVELRAQRRGLLFEFPGELLPTFLVVTPLAPVRVRLPVLARVADGLEAPAADVAWTPRPRWAWNTLQCTVLHAENLARITLVRLPDLNCAKPALYEVGLLCLIH